MTTIGRSVLTRLLTVCLAVLFLLEPFALPLALAVESAPVAPTEAGASVVATTTAESLTEAELPAERTAYSCEFARSDGFGDQLGLPVRQLPYHHLTWAHREWNHQSGRSERRWGMG